MSTIPSSSLVGGGFKLVPPLIVPSPLPSDDSAAGDWKADNETEESDSRVRVVLKDTEDASDAVEERSPAAAAEENADASISASDPKQNPENRIRMYLRFYFRTMTTTKNKNKNSDGRMTRTKEEKEREILMLMCYRIVLNHKNAFVVLVIKMNGTHN